MSKVALRVYNREIETLIDQEHIEEAIAHCQHILKLYPKHLETYRLLGKAYLEGRRYADAADIFQRILMTVPDDFISHLGMSIVSDEQKDLDGAIWHMERAFEVDPSNSGVQGELRRLYGRRDGLEPPKIRLTRGALAQMYTKGGQYQQAIAEIKAVLAEDPTRIEMKVLLGRAFYRGGQKVEATEMCIELLKQFPYCLDANRILVEVLPGTSLGQNVDTYKKRVEALDPYSAFTTSSIFEVENAPDNAVSLERLEWEPGSGSFAPARSDQSGEAIPDFLRSSGWGPSTGEFQEGATDFDSPEPATPAASSELAAAQIPDWLKAMAPPGSSAQQAEQSASAPATGQDLASEDLDWLAGLGSPAAGGQSPVESQAESAGPAAEAQPDWLKDLGSSAPESQPAESQPQAAEPTPAGDQPEWLKELGISAPEDQPAESQPQATETTPAGDQADWLKDLGSLEDENQPGAMAEILPETTSVMPEAAQPVASDDMDWLKNLGSAPDTAAPEAESLPQSRPEANMKKDLSGDDEDIPPMTAPVSGPGTSESEQDDAMKWLESLAQKQGAKAEELITNPNERTEHAPDWVAKVDEEVPAVPVMETPAPPKVEAPAEFVPERPAAFDEDAPPGELSPLISAPGTTETEQDDAMKWLEGLAEKQGAKAEELITNVDERSHDAPAWVTEGSAEASPPAAEVPPSPQAAEPAASEQDDTMAWLQGLAAGQPAEASSEAPASTPAESLSMPWEQTEAPAQPVEPMPWEQEIPSATVESQPAEAQPGSDVSQWLKNLEIEEQGQPAAETPVAAEPQQPAAVANEEFPDWLNSMRAPEGEGQAAQEDLPDWLKDQSADEQPPAAVAAPEWIPAEETPSPSLGVMEPPPMETPVSETPTPVAAQPVAVEPTAPVETIHPAGMAPPAETMPPAGIVSFEVPAQEPEPLPVPTPPVPVPAAVRQTSILSDKDGPALQRARDLMAQNGLDEAVSEYAKLVKRGKLLEEVIYDLKEATYSHPVDVIVWQALGDAHMRANQLQEALDAYTKAEELLR
jgi:tetratricopeptide (TPR) repeat protein